MSSKTSTTVPTGQKMSSKTTITEPTGPKTTASKFSLNYFNRIGKIELVKLIFAVGNVKYTDNYIENLTDSGIL